VSWAVVPGPPSLAEGFRHAEHFDGFSDEAATTMPGVKVLSLADRSHGGPGSLKYFCPKRFLTWRARHVHCFVMPPDRAIEFAIADNEEPRNRLRALFERVSGTYHPRNLGQQIYP